MRRFKRKTGDEDEVEDAKHRRPAHSSLGNFKADTRRAARAPQPLEGLHPGTLRPGRTARSADNCSGTPSRSETSTPPSAHDLHALTPRRRSVMSWAYLRLATLLRPASTNVLSNVGLPLRPPSMTSVMNGEGEGARASRPSQRSSQRNVLSWLSIRPPMRPSTDRNLCSLATWRWTTSFRSPNARATELCAGLCRLVAEVEGPRSLIVVRAALQRARRECERRAHAGSVRQKNRVCPRGSPHCID